jgi:Fe-S cluster assembly protein SufD
MGETKLTDVKAFSKRLGENAAALGRRVKAFNSLRGSSGVFMYGMNITAVFEPDYAKMKLLKAADFEINSNGKALVMNLKEAAREKIFDENAFATIENESEPAAANIAFMNSAAFIRLPAGKDCGTIHLKLKGSGADFAYILVIAEEGSRATIIDEITLTEAEYRSCIVEIKAKQASEVKFATVQKLPECRNYLLKKASVMKDANVEWLDIATGSSATKAEVYSDLIGQGARSSIFSVFFGSKSQQFDFINKCTHIGRDTESLILSSGALKDKAKAIQQSFAKISAKAYNSAAHQKSKILLLSKEAKAAPIPKLEIGNNEVAATHEASVGQIDSEKLFYLMSRGLDNNNARKLYVEGFFEQYASMITVPELREDIEKTITGRMEA